MASNVTPRYLIMSFIAGVRCNNFSTFQNACKFALTALIICYGNMRRIPCAQLDFSLQPRNITPCFDKFSFSFGRYKYAG